MMIHPCCGYPLYNVVKYMAIVDMVLGGLNALLFAIAFIYGLTADVPPDELTGYRFALFIILVAFILVAGDVYLAYVLYTGAIERNVEKCEKWFKMKAIVVGIKILIFFISFAIAATSANFGIKAPTFYIYPLYMMWVVHTFIGEVKTDPASFGAYNTVGD